MRVATAGAAWIPFSNPCRPVTVSLSMTSRLRATRLKYGCPRAMIPRFPFLNLMEYNNAFEIFTIVDGPISLEVVSEKAKDMVKEAKGLYNSVSKQYQKNVAIKVPMTPEGLKAVKTLSEEGIQTNVTLVFSANQALLAAKAGATFVSPFIGRLDDIGHNGMQIIEEIVEIFYNYNIETEVIVASIRHPIHVIEAARIGADIATIPPQIIRKMSRHALTDVGIEQFSKDWKIVKK